MRIGYVSPRYGPDVIGGAEFGVRMLAEHLAADRGFDVAVHTTTATDARTWADRSPAGTTEERGVTVHRHRVVGERSRDFDRLSDRVLGDPERAADDLERRWFRAQGPHAPSLLDSLDEVDHDVTVFYPYLYEPTIDGIHRVNGARAMHPAAHDEAPLRLPRVGKALAACTGLAFQTTAERRIAERAHPVAAERRQVMVGLGVDEVAGDEALARERLGVGDDPYLLVLGRVDRGKGVHRLVDAWGRVGREFPSVRLVVAGPIVDPVPATPGVLVTGPIDDDVKWGALTGATALVNPSPNESFSLVLLEAWSAGTPTLVTAECAATVEHVRRSRGGFSYRDDAELAAAVGLLLGDGARALALGDSGRRYVDRWFRWPEVLDRYVPFLERVAERPAPRT